MYSYPDILRIKRIDGFISDLKNFKSLNILKDNNTLKAIYTIPKKPALGVMNDESSIAKLGKFRNRSIFYILNNYFFF